MMKWKEAVLKGLKGRGLFILAMVFSTVLTVSCANNHGTAVEEEKAEVSQDKENKIVAKVNGQAVYEDQLTPYVNKELKKFSKYGGGKDKTALVNRTQKRALAQVIEGLLINQEAQKLTIDDMDERIDKEIEAMKAQYGGEERFQTFLEIRQLTLESLRESLPGKIYGDEYLRINGISDPEIPDEQVQEFYDRDPSGFHRDATMDVSHILIKVEENAEPEVFEEARKKAEKIGKEIRAGKDFGDMAKEHSDCNSASGGGKLGPLKKGYMPKEFDAAAFALEKDGVSEPVQSAHGIHIIKLHGKTEAGNAPVEQVREFIRKYLQEGESKKKMAEHLAALKESAQIEIYLDE